MKMLSFRSLFAATLAVVAIAAVVLGVTGFSARAQNASADIVPVQFHGASIQKQCVTPKRVGQATDCLIRVSYNDDFGDTLKISDAWDIVFATAANTRVPTVGNLPIVAVTGNTTCTVAGSLPCNFGPAGSTLNGLPGTGTTGQVTFESNAYVIQANDPNPLNDQANANVQDLCDAQGTTGCSNVVNDLQFTASTQIIHPHTTLTKTASPTTGSVPLPVTYTIKETNDGDAPITAVGVTDSDPTNCTLARQPDAPGNNDNTLAVGETWVFTCLVTYNTAGTFGDTALATGTAPDGAAPACGPTQTAPGAQCGPNGEEKATASVTVNPVQPTLTTTASAGGNVPLAIHDTAHLSGGVSPTGTIRFDLYGPNDATCSTSIFNNTQTVNGNGDYNSASFTANTAGTYRWIASYTSGDVNNLNAGPTSCSDAAESVVVNPVQPTLTTTASAGGNVPLAIHDTAHLSGGVSPTGTIRFDLYGPNDATCSTSIFNNTQTVNGNGDYNSASFTANTAGTYRWIASYTSGDVNNLNAGPTSCSDAAESVVVNPVQPTLTTTASAGGNVPLAIHDTAHLSGGVSPTGTIRFDLYGPNDATCSTSIFNNTQTVNGNGDYNSASFTANTAGTYRWIASYTSGDANNLNAGPTSCSDAAESVVVNPGQPTLTTTASAGGNVPLAIHDTAHLSGGVSPTGTIRFDLYGPNDATCSTSIFNNTQTVNGNGDYNSASFTANTAGTYRWIASYTSGDVNNLNAGPTSCSDAAESVVVNPVQPTLTTTASAGGNVPLAIHDTAHLSGGVSPTGTIRFDLYGPNDATCSTSIFNNTQTVNGNGDYNSASFTANTAGTYRWIASYTSGDANNLNAGPTSCSDAAESVVVTSQGGQITPTNVDCTDILNGTAPTLGQINYTSTGGPNPKIGQNINPGVFFFWTKITTTVPNQVVTVSQSNTSTNNAALFLVHQGWDRVYAGDCSSWKAGTEIAGGSGASFTIATPGSYIIGVKYQTKSIAGTKVPVPADITYNFSTSLGGSTGASVLLKKQ